MKRAVTHRAVAKKANRNLFTPPKLRRESRASTQRHARPDDAVCTQKSVFGVVNVHAAPTPPIASIGLAPYLGKHRPHRNALGNCVSVAAMGAGDVVVLV